jgi:pentose-5-phosphate-3-epimerase
MKISASIYSNRDKALPELIRELDAYKVDFFHIDCMDDASVFTDIQAIRGISKTPFDLHLISPDPDRYIDLITTAGVEYVTLQYENLPAFPQLFRQPGIQFGLALTSDTPVEVFGDYADCCSFVLFMTTIPGQSGGAFNSTTFKRIRKFRALFPNKKIHVDGGINAEVSFILRNMGVYTSVIGSYLFKGQFIGSAMLKLRSDDVRSRYCVRDFMLQRDEVPVIDSSHTDFRSILQSIEEFRMGFTMVADAEGRLAGIISNADVRKGLLRQIDSLDRLDTSAMINRDPAFVYEDMEVSELLNFVKNLSFPVLFLPVVDRSERIVGTIKFNNLIKGES